MGVDHSAELYIPCSKLKNDAFYRYSYYGTQTSYPMPEVTPTGQHGCMVTKSAEDKKYVVST